MHVCCNYGKTRNNDNREAVDTSPFVRARRMINPWISSFFSIILLSEISCSNETLSLVLWFPLLSPFSLWFQARRGRRNTDQPTREQPHSVISDNPSFHDGIYLLRFLTHFIGLWKTAKIASTASKPVDFIGKRHRSWSTIWYVVLDAEIAFWAAWIVTRRQYETAKQFFLPVTQVEPKFTRPDRRLKSSYWRVGRGSCEDGQGQYGAGL